MTSAAPQDIHTRSARVSLLAGVAAGVANVLTGHPLDTLKVWAQTANGRGVQDLKVNDTASCVRTIKTLYRGLGPPILVVSFVSSLNFSIYEAARVKIFGFWPGIHDVPCAWLAGCTSGYAVCHITNPMNVVKVRQQTGGGKLQGESMAAVSRRLWQTHGLRGFFKGYVPHAGMESIGRGFYMATYVGAKRCLGLSDDSGSYALRILCGSSAGISAWVAAYPMDVVRNNLQSSDERKSGFRCAREIVARDGFRGLYRGLGFTVLRAGPIAAVTLPTYDFACATLRRWL
eukprot:TRINITY_DN61938_c0_g1_i1.p1 TRINITY_DN61938_c0_g1~~TRINITY_DN61938_c0_g1_i1.p1  ORF type:complete len:288 (+),score=45.85 TRINITY_DN61938_c0_g1_i1:89-952(+)